MDRPHIRRSRSPRSHHHHHHSSSHKNRSLKPPAPALLPFNAPGLSKHSFKDYKPIFGLYLDIQKQLILENLPDSEVRGRWKSFVGKWNRGMLAEGWYDPATLQKAQASVASNVDRAEPQYRRRGSPSYGPAVGIYNSSDEDLVGPTLPGGDVIARRAGKRPGPAIPNLQDLELRKELGQENTALQRQDLRDHRRLDRKQQKEQLEELVPRAEAGTKDRMLEKKREKADSNRAFASAKTETGGVEEVPESDLLGDEDGGVEGFKKQKRETERKKNERELRREEIMRARAEEREERFREYKAREEKTMSGLVALARARFG
ncbi:hypothetical protein MMC28_003593 [Mycoblastus sanguinarius]|nr:hypothetical protein [Mycoblastus sanguinarius]